MNRFKKQDLKGSTLYPETLVKKSTDINVLLEWRVPNYKDLKQNVLYYTKAVEASCLWTLRLVRRNETLFLSMKTDAPKENVYFHICNRDGSVGKKSSQCKENSEGHYVAEFSDKSICNPKSTFLNDGELLIQCKYLAEPRKEGHKYLDYGHLRFPADVDQLTEDFKRLFKTGYATDFTLKVRGFEFSVHKLMLFTRCHYFFVYFQKKGFACEELELDAHPYIVRTVLMFVYTGKLENDLDVGRIKGVCLLANWLGIGSLVKRCLKMLEESISSNNIKEISLFAVKKGFKDLVRAVHNFLDKPELEISADELTELTEILKLQIPQAEH